MTDETHDDLFDAGDDMSEELAPSEAQADAAPTGFRERLDENLEDDDFTRSLDPSENPHIDDQLTDENLQREAEADY